MNDRLDGKQVRKRSFFRFARTQKRERVDSLSSLLDAPKRMSTLNASNKRPRFSSTVSAAPRRSTLRGNLFDSFRRRSSVRSNAGYASETVGRKSRFSVFSIGARGSSARPNFGPTLPRGRRPSKSRGRASLGGNWLAFGSHSSTQVKEVSVAPIQTLTTLNKAVWEKRTTLSGATYYWHTIKSQHSWEKPTELMSVQEREENNKDWVWVPHAMNLWQPGYIAGKTKKGTTVKIYGGQMILIPNIKIMKGPLTGGVSQRVPLTPLKRDTLDLILDDLVELPAVNEGSLLHNTRLRYESGLIYTWIGASRNVLLALNPYEDLGLYTDEFKKKYEKAAVSLEVPKPHVFAVAADCLESLSNQGQSQSILVSGESGAGKTQATKQCLDFITHVAGSTKVVKQEPVVSAFGKKKPAKKPTRRRRRAPKREMPGEASVKMVNAGESNALEDKILKCNPIMEAFGNAKTVRNNNSSRFGKWIALFMFPKKKQVSGAMIQQFLLETTRVIQQAKNERNYHIFYQIFKDDDLKERLHLTEPSEFHYINQGDCYEVGGKNPIDDKQEFEDVKLAMAKLNFEDEERDWFFKIVASVLHLGNVNFEAVTGDRAVKSSKISDEASENHLKHSAAFLDVEYETLKTVLLSRTIRTSKDSTRKPHTKPQAEGARNSLAKAVYGRMFQFLIEKINDSFGARTQPRLIGILDIFGFESFETNSFEQLCINFTNERLQKLFNDTTYMEEQQLYAMEKIKYEKVKFSDNQLVLDIMDTPPHGIFNLLDDECKVPGGTEMRLLQRIIGLHRDKTKLFRSDVKSKTFTITHFAGKVSYTITGFIAKNVDSLNQDLYDVCATSTDQLTTGLFPALQENERVKIRSTSSKFREQLKDLTKVLQETQTHYIRCIKPNNEQVPGKFNGRKIIGQLNAVGVLDSIHTRQVGYSHKMFHQQFYNTYRLAPGCKFSFTSGKNDYKALCKELIEEVFKDRLKNMPGIQIGTVRVLYRPEEYKFLELNKTISISEAFTLLQARVRGNEAKKFYTNFKAIGAELDLALRSGDLEGIEALQGSMKDRLGRLGKLYRIAPKNLEKAKEKIKLKRLWDPIIEKLDKYSAIKVDKDDDQFELEEDIAETLDEDAMEALIAEILVIEEKTPMPFEVKHGLGHLKALRGAVHRYGLNKQFNELLKEEEHMDELTDVQELESQPDPDQDQLTISIPDPGDDTPIEEGQQMPEDLAPSLPAQDVAKVSKMSKLTKTFGQVPTAEAFAEKDKQMALESVEADGKKALASLDKEVLRSVVVKAVEYDYSSPTVEEVKTVLKLSTEDFLKQEIKVAKAANNDKLVQEKNLELREVVLAQNFEKYKHFHKLPTLRNPPEEVDFITCFCIPNGSGVRELSSEEETDHRMDNKRRKFFQWQRDDLLELTLLRLPDDLAELSFTCFEKVFSYLEYGTEPDGSDLVQTGVFQGGGSNPGLRNEIFAQIVKQLIQNPSPDSRVRGVELLGVCLACFPPDDEEFTRFLLVWMRLHLPYAIFRHYVSAANNTRLGNDSKDPTHNGANKKVGNKTTFPQMRKLLDESREGSRFSRRGFEDVWNIPNDLIKNVLKEYNVNEEFLASDKQVNPPRKSIKSKRSTKKSSLKTGSTDLIT